MGHYVWDTQYLSNVHPFYLSMYFDIYFDSTYWTHSIQTCTVSSLQQYSMSMESCPIFIVPGIHKNGKDFAGIL